MIIYIFLNIVPSLFCVYTILAVLFISLVPRGNWILRWLFSLTPCPPPPSDWPPYYRRYMWHWTLTSQYVSIQSASCLRCQSTGELISARAAWPNLSSTIMYCRGSANCKYFLVKIFSNSLAYVKIKYACTSLMGMQYRVVCQKII